jgi:uncharacterized membrane protein
MNRFRNFIYTVFIGGFGVVLPVAILIMVFTFVFRFVAGLLDPFTQLLEANFEVHAPLTDLIVIGFILSLAFLIGLLLRTGFGKWLYQYIEQKYLEATPGYKLIRETTTQLMSGKQSPLSRVAMVRPFNNETIMTGFITHEHADGTVTVFIPMAPPTSGFIFHLDGAQVTPVDVPTQEAMKIFISLGAGSDKLMEKYRQSANTSRKSSSS